VAPAENPRHLSNDARRRRLGAAALLARVCRSRRPAKARGARAAEAPRWGFIPTPCWHHPRPPSRGRLAARPLPSARLLPERCRALTSPPTADLPREARRSAKAAALLAVDRPVGPPVDRPLQRRGQGWRQETFRRRADRPAALPAPQTAEGPRPVRAEAEPVPPVVLATAAAGLIGCKDTYSTPYSSISFSTSLHQTSADGGYFYPRLQVERGGLLNIEYPAARFNERPSSIYFQVFEEIIVCRSTERSFLLPKSVVSPINKHSCYRLIR
jgi:hypothetical protein